MANTQNTPTNRKRGFIRYLLLFAAALLVTVMVPKKGKFRYEYELGKPWQHEDLIAPFAFAIHKPDKDIAAEKKDIRDNFKPFYVRNDDIQERKLAEFRKSLHDNITSEYELNPEQAAHLMSEGERMIRDIYAKGIINPDTAHNRKPPSFAIQELHNAEATDKNIGSYYLLNEARQLITQHTQDDVNLNKSLYTQALLKALDYNILYERDLSTKKLNELLETVSTTSGMVNENDKIIARSNIITPARYQMLNSLQNEYESQVNQGTSTPMYFFGYLLIILILFLLYGFDLSLFHPEIAKSSRSLIAILLNILLFTFATSYLVRTDFLNIYLLPYCIVPIVLLAFFGTRIAHVTHFLIVLLCGLMAPNPYEFMLLQLTGGFVAIISMARIRYISQFFSSSMLIFFSYCVTYFGILLIHSSNIYQMHWKDFMWFGGNFILTLLAYPLIYTNEKIFGFLSDVSLLELSDVNNKLLKELSVRAPGTFQHSLQVANLSEAVVDRIGGNALLTRVGALYHDIGKIYNPTFFIENQSFMQNPHTNMDDEESAEIIIQHVTRGITMAQEYSLPEKIIDFIRSHHGTTRVEYFYQSYLKHHPEVDKDDTQFRYPGPKPSSKEMAIVMICDSVEAASRSLQQPDERQIDILVDKIIDHKLTDHQFDLATITIQEVNSTRRLLKKLIKSIYHIRVIYPSSEEKTEV
jgi:putative nucleotidyltransferase with HDIG domain